MSEVKKSEVLRNCPFCGGEAIKSAFSWGNISDEFTIKCTVCGARTTVLKSEQAIKAWNTRKPMDDIVERLEDLQQPCYECRESCNEKCVIERAIDIVKEVGGSCD